MNQIKKKEFLRRCKSWNIGLDLRYEEPRCLVFTPYRSFDRFWEVPKDPDECIKFATHLLKGSASWSRCMACMRGGYWPFGDKTDEHLGLLKRAGVPLKTECALEFEVTELARIVDLTTTQLFHGWSVDDDLFLIPDHGYYFIQTDHHGVVHVSFAEEGRIQGFIDYMAREGYLLPKEVPDETFKHPDWMK